MKRYALWIIPAILVCTLLLTGVVSARSGGRPTAAPYTVEAGVTSGGTYHLTVLAWRVGGVVGGPGYLLSPAAPALRGSGCCCLYLPCILRNH